MRIVRNNLYTTEADDDEDTGHYCHTYVTMFKREINPTRNMYAKSGLSWFIFKYWPSPSVSYEAVCKDRKFLAPLARWAGLELEVYDEP